MVLLAPDPRCEFTDCPFKFANDCSQYLKRGAICLDGWFGNSTYAGLTGNKTKKEIQVSPRNTVKLRDIF